MLTGVKPFQAYQHSKTPACPTCTLLPSPAHPRFIVVVVGVATGVPDVNVDVGLVGGGVELVVDEVDDEPPPPPPEPPLPPEPPEPPPLPLPPPLPPPPEPLPPPLPPEPPLPPPVPLLELQDTVKLM